MKISIAGICVILVGLVAVPLIILFPENGLQRPLKTGASSSRDIGLVKTNPSSPADDKASTRTRRPAIRQKKSAVRKPRFIPFRPQIDRLPDYEIDVINSDWQSPIDIADFGPSGSVVTYYEPTFPDDPTGQKSNSSNYLDTDKHEGASEEYFDFVGQASIQRDNGPSIGDRKIRQDRQWLRSLDRYPAILSKTGFEMKTPTPVQEKANTVAAARIPETGSGKAPSTEMAGAPVPKTSSITHRAPNENTTRHKHSQPVASTSTQPILDSAKAIVRHATEQLDKQAIDKSSAISIRSGSALPAPELTVRVAAEPVKQDPVIVGWPLPETLIDDLDHLSQFAVTSKWAIAARDALKTLNEMEVSDLESRSWILHCHTLAGQLRDFSNNLSQTSTTHVDSCLYMLQVAQSMRRRSEIWLQVHLIAAEDLAVVPGTLGNLIADQIANRSREVNFESIDPLWAKYLMMEQAAEIFSSSKSRETRYQAIAQKIMSRVTSSSLNREQTTYAQNLIGNDLGEVLRTVAVGQLDLGQFLIDLERYETKATVGSQARLNSHFQSYYWHRNKRIRELSDLIDDHYRNANIRIEFSQELLNQVIPSERTVYHEPVTDRILGAKVFGQSRITNQISVQLMPDAERLSFRLHSNGRVLSSTRAHARGFTFSNLGNAQVNASKVFAIGQDGVSFEPTYVTANSQTRLTDIKGQMDIVPVFGSLAKKIAHQQQQSQGFQAKQIVENRMRNEFRTRIDEEMQQQLARGKDWFETHVVNPLHAMELEPTVVQLQTTSQSAIVRYRLASLDQNAADTPRPMAQPGSLANFQVHRSAINNLINRIHINGRTFTPPEFTDHINQLLGRNDLSVPPEQRKDVSFEFASKNAIKLDFQDNMVEISLRIKTLQISNRSRWKNLIVTARYSPTAAGQKLYLQFDDDFGLRVSGRRLKLADQLAVRTVFSALFKPEFQFNLVPPRMAAHQAALGLEISHLVLTEGWLGVSLNRIPVQASQVELQTGTYANPAVYQPQVTMQWRAGSPQRYDVRHHPRQSTQQATRYQRPSLARPSSGNWR